MSAVVWAQHIQLGEPVAVKFLHPKLARDHVSVERFVREARATSRIKSEHVVGVIDIGAMDNGLPFIAMELLEGEDLGHASATTPLTIVLAVDCVLQAADALAEAHAAGIVHRDIKPSNLWLARRRDGSPLVKVLDFGISKLLSAQGVDRRLTETHTHAVFGSPTYMSPEQIRSAKNVDHEADVWSLGVVLHELLTCRMPFEAPTVSGVLASIIADAPMRLREVRPDAPAGLEAAILRCLEKNPRKRASLAELAADLRPFASKLGEISADRIAGAGSPPTAISLPPPSSGRISERDVALATTERNLATTRVVGSARLRSSRMRVVIGLGIIAVVNSTIVAAKVTIFSTKPPIARVEPTAAPPPPAVGVESPAEVHDPAPPAAPSAAILKASTDARSPARKPALKPRGTIATATATATTSPTAGTALGTTTTAPLSTTGRE